MTSPLVSASRRPGILARALFWTMDVVYGKALSLERFAALELVARVPYQAWENVAYTAITHVSRRPGFARRIFEFVLEAREAQDNEQWHLLILEELVDERGVRRSVWKARVIPQLLAVCYYHLSWSLYVISPKLSYSLNADFEEHAERGYLEYVHAHPELELAPWSSQFAGDYGQHRTIADLFRRVAKDEALHAAHSRAHLTAPRFRDEDGPAASGRLTAGHGHS